MLASMEGEGYKNIDKVSKILNSVRGGLFFEFLYTHLRAMKRLAYSISEDNYIFKERKKHVFFYFQKHFLDFLTVAE
jgi:hypothetical protein